MLADYKAVTDKEKEEVVGLGGLHVVGTERHESRRIDNQLRGRAGRQGDPGSTRCDDGLLRDEAKHCWLCIIALRMTLVQGTDPC